jgi:hypothetical protein
MKTNPPIPDPSHVRAEVLRVVGLVVGRAFEGVEATGLAEDAPVLAAGETIQVEGADADVDHAATDRDSRISSANSRISMRESPVAVATCPSDKAPSTCN